MRHHERTTLKLKKATSYPLPSARKEQETASHTGRLLHDIHLRGGQAAADELRPSLGGLRRLLNYVHLRGGLGRC